MDLQVGQDKTLRITFNYFFLSLRSIFNLSANPAKTSSSFETHLRSRTSPHSLSYLDYYSSLVTSLDSTFPAILFST